MTSFLRSDRARPVAVWLFCVAALVFAMVVVGGATRLTGSGLSITEWKPIMGVLPPLNAAAWAEAFAKYQKIPQYRLVNAGMSLSAFKAIFWWEWTHRLIGRLLGVAFAGPLIAFLALRRVPGRLVLRLLGLFVLGALQGFVGWWMVQSGLETRISVAPERLATHLGLALALFSALIWTGLEAWTGAKRLGRPATPWAPAAIAIALLAYVQCLLGALVAGNQAGLVDNDWPLMRGRFFPDDYWAGGLWRSLLHSKAAVQFDHRMGAYALLALVLGATIAVLLARAEGAVRGLALTLSLLVVAQAGLGVATLMLVVPLHLAVLHQAGAAIVLATAVAFAWRALRPAV
jgi:cytochrome c oxidase assembly protein subunit 15